MSVFRSIASALSAAHPGAIRRSLFRCLSLATLGFGLAAHATTINAGVYNLENAYVNGYAVTGTVTFNSTGNATAANLIYQNPNFDDPGLPDLNQVSLTTAYNGISQNYLSSTSGIGQIALYLNTTADANGRFDLCLTGAQCGTSSGTVDPATLQIYGFYNSTTATSNSGQAATNFTSGYFDQVSTPATTATPEPSTLVLLGTGFLGIAGVARRRFLNI